MPSAPRDIAARPVRTTSTSPSGTISEMKLSILDGLPVTSNTGEPIGRHHHTQPADNTIHHDAAHPSRITLPVVAME